jgi:aspartyl-tRNA(Asn)/glutamyl-tRNA(Gln) amidotransferase subunit A
MTVTDPTSLPVHHLSRAISTRALSPVDVVDAYLEKIRSLDPRFKAYSAVYFDDARLAAEAADKAIRSGHALGPLHGIPIALKDLVELKGRTVSGGSMIWQDRKSEQTARLAKRLITQGIIILGKTHLVEFAFGGWGTNQRLGTPLNPWNLDTPYTPGGSSSGSGVAVAAGLAPWAVGTDTGGSVRMPASFCGLTGLKPSVGRISTDGLLPLSTTLDTPGPMARSVEDVALLYHAMRTDQCDAGEPYQPSSVRGLRLGSLPASERRGIEASVLDAYDRSLEVFGRLGAEIAPVSLPFSLADLAELNGLIISTEAYGFLGGYVEDRELPLDDDVRPRVLAGQNVSAKSYLAALEQRELLKRQFVQALADVDALLTPTTATTAIPLSEVNQAKTPAYFTRFVNLLDLCGLALPNGMSARHLPTSLQIVCRNNDEETALRIGRAYQQATDWHERQPPAP